MKQLEDLEFRLSDKGIFTPQRNVDVLFPYLVERVEQEGAVDLRAIGYQLAERFSRHWKGDVAYALYTTAQLVNPQFNLRMITLRDAIKKVNPDVCDIKYLKGSCGKEKLLYKEETALSDYVRRRTERRGVVIVELKGEGGQNAS